MASVSVSCFKNRRLTVILHFVSFTLLYLPNGVAWYFGNLVVYLNSYWYARHDSKTFVSAWLISTYVMAASACVIIAGNFIKRFDQRIFTFIGALCFNTGVFLTYLTMQHSQEAFILTYGVLTGIGFGAIQTEIFTRISDLVSKRTGLAFAFLNNSFSIGAILFEWVVTWYANPYNAEADTLVLGRYKLFSNKFVIDRVPNIFIVIGLISSLCHFSGLALTVILRDRGKVYGVKQCTHASEDIVISHALESTPLSQGVKDISVGKGKLTIDSNNTVSLSSNTENFKIVQVYDTGSSEGINDGDNDRAKRNKDESQMKGSIDDSNREDMNQCQMVKTLTFYLLWSNFFANDSAYVALLNYYKIFGELWIRDDYFLTQLGMTALFTVVVTRIALAFCIDRFGIKPIQVCLTSLMSLTFTWYYFTPQINPWLFAVWTSIVTSLCSAVYLNFPIMALKIFGRTYFASNYGLLSTSTIVLNLIAPQIFNTIVQYWGWPAVFIGIGALNAIAMLAIVPGLPNLL